MDNDSLNRARTIFPQGSYVTTITEAVGRNGDSWSIRTLTTDVDGRIWDASGIVAKAIGNRFDQKRGGVRVKGGGMDMGFHVVYTLAQALYGDGYALTHNRV